MKDYYYFLGVDKDDSQDEIRKAYRKISLRCHPDKTDNDPFFQKRFRELREAYEVLMDEDRRQTYDRMLEREQAGNMKSQVVPTIKQFHTNKNKAIKGEEIILSWRTMDSDLVKIHPFGLQKAFGEKHFTMDDFDENGKFSIIINATNSFLNKTVAQRITITEVFEGNNAELPIEGELEKATEQGFPSYLFWILITLLFLGLMVIFLAN